MAVSPTPPSITLLPPAPLPTDPEAVFDTKAGARLSAEEVMVPEINIATTWVAGAMAETNGYKDAAATSAGNAADSATLAGQKVGLATDQVVLATTQANNAAASATSAQIYAAACQAAVGAPALVGNAGKVLGVNSLETGVAWVNGLPLLAGNAGKVLQVNAAENSATWVLVGSVFATDEKVSGTASADSVGAAYGTRTLNTLKFNTLGATLANNAVTLPPGKYRIHASAPMYNLTASKLRLYNVTASTVIASGQNMYETGGDRATLYCEINLISPTAIRVEHRAAQGGVSGIACGFGDAETYTTFLAERIG